MNAPFGTVLITGCSSGIGRELALNFSRRGLPVWATARRLADLRDLAEQPGVVTAELDVGDPASIATLVARLAAERVAIGVLVNNAGYGQMGPLAELPIESIRRQFDVNVFGAMALTQALLPSMIERRRGRIANIGSISGVLATPFSGAYCASKSALHMLSDMLRLEVGSFGIDVTTVQPGLIRSRFGDNASASLQAWRRAAEATGRPSAYDAQRQRIEQRAQASQARAATDASVFAQHLAEAMLSTRPPAVLRLGSASSLMPWVKRWLPARWLDRVLRKRFGLN